MMSGLVVKSCRPLVRQQVSLLGGPQSVMVCRLSGHPKVHPYRLPLERQLLLNTIDDHGKISSHDLWEKVQGMGELKSRRTMKIVIKYLREAKLVVARPPENPEDKKYELHCGKKYLRRKDYIERSAQSKVGIDPAALQQPLQQA